MENTNVATNISDSIVSCTGGSCGFCSFLGTLSNLYTFFLLIGFAVGIAVLVISGANYIFNQSGKEEQKNIYRKIKSILLGFSLIILGWLIITTTYRVLGYKNAGSWYQFQCSLEGQELTPKKTNFGSYYQNLKIFKEISGFLDSRNQKGGIEGPSTTPAIQKQLQELTDGEILHFLAPVRVETSSGYDDLFLPLLTVKRDGDQIKLDSLGEYFGLIQNQYAQSDKTDSVLNTLIDTLPRADDRTLINVDGEELSSNSFNNIYDQISQIIKNQQPNSDKNLDDAMANSANSESNDEVQRIVAILISESLKTSKLLMLEKEYSTEILTDAKTNCQLSFGEWINNKCVCPINTQLVKDTCKENNDLKNKCEKSGGLWELVAEGYSPTISCGYLENSFDVNPLIEEAFQRANISDVASDNSYCMCPSGTCIDGDNVCRKQEEDSDGDKIVNSRDRCPNTSKADIQEINTQAGSQYYGCSCNDIGIQTKECPPDQCVGDYKVTYPKGAKTCSKGETGTYSCASTGKIYDQSCVNQNKNSNNNSNINKNSSPSSSSSSGGGSGSGKNKINDDFFGKGKEGLNIGDNKLGPGGGNAMNSNPEGIKAALRRIHDTDPLRYEMIFRYVSTIAPTSFSGGLCYGCGYVEVNYGLPLKMLDQVVVHESTHSGHFCRGMSETTAEVERIAVGNEIGSLERAQKDDKGRDIKYPMDEFPRQSKQIDYESLSVRGYLSRFMPENNPKGDLVPADYHWAISYALSYGDNTKGPNHYGWPKKGYLLGLKDKEENVIKRIMNMEDFPCKSKPPSDLPEVPACKDAKNELKLGGK